MGEKLVTTFQNQVYKALQDIPEGKISTYGDLAKFLNINSSQAIGQACKRNPFAPDVPCHRVVASNGSIGGFNGAKSGSKIKKKITLLRTEGVQVKNGKIQDFAHVRHMWK